MARTPIVVIFALVAITAACVAFQNLVFTPTWFSRGGAPVSQTSFGQDVILQKDASDCGPAAVANLLRYFHRDQSLQELEKVAAPGELGVTSDTVARLLTQFGVKATVRVRSKWAPLPRTPFIALRRQHFVVVLRSLPKGRYEVVDPWFGDRVQSQQTFYAGLSPYLIVPEQARYGV